MGGIHGWQANLVRDRYVWRKAYWLKGHIHALRSLKLMVHKHFREFIRYLIFASKSLSIHHCSSQGPRYKQTSARFTAWCHPVVLSDVVSCCVSQQNCPQWPGIRSSYREKLHQKKRKRECNNKVHEGNSFLKNNSSAIIYPKRMTFFYSSFTHILFCT